MTLSKVEKLLKQIVSEKFKDEENIFSISEPPPHIKDDLSTSFAIAVSKRKKIPIDEVLNEIKNLFEKNNLEVNIQKPFINIKLPIKIYEEYLNELNSNNFLFYQEKYQNIKVIIEFVSANPTGPLHLASASGAALGDSLSRILKETGYQIFKEYYVNDTGKQIELLGKSLMARYRGEPPPPDGYQGEYLIEMAEYLKKNLREKADEWNKNNNYMEFASFAKEYIIKQQKEDLEKFDLIFDNWFYESELHKDNLPEKILEILEEKGAVEEKDGAKWLKTDNSEDKERVLVKSNGQKTYFLNDLAYHWTKYERSFNWIIDIWGADHHGYIPRMKAGIKLLGLDESKFTVIIHQLVSIKKGNEIIKMSKRQGKFHTLRELIEETSKDAVRFFFTTRSPNTHLVFDIELAKKQSQENPLYYVQYAHARINSIIENAKNYINIETLNSFGDYTPNDDERKILKKLFYFEKTIHQCIKDLSPHHITIYLIELAKEFHSYYEKHKIINPEDKNTTKARIFLIKGIKKILQKGLNLIGVSAPEKM